MCHLPSLMHLGLCICYCLCLRCFSHSDLSTKFLTILQGPTETSPQRVTPNTIGPSSLQPLECSSLHAPLTWPCLLHTVPEGQRPAKALPAPVGRSGRGTQSVKLCQLAGEPPLKVSFQWMSVERKHCATNIETQKPPFFLPNDGQA